MKRHSGESGYAMLLVFLMAAMVAIMLYSELPRVAFEAERQREIMLLDRGNQYKRAIQVFFTDKVNNPTHRYPASIDELESFNNHRYLRRRYVDPMTGKDEWRLVHINGGVLTDSVTTQAKSPQSAGGSGTAAGPAYISENPYMDTGAGNAAMGGATRALNRRPSEQPGAPGDPNAPGGIPGGSAGMTGDASGGGNNLPGGGIPGVPGAPGQNGMPGQPVLPGQGIPGMPGQQQSQPQQAAQQPCTVYIGSCPPTTNSQQPGQMQGQQPGYPAGFAGLQPGSQMNGTGTPTPATPGMPGSPGGAQSMASNLINNLLTTPRPGGMPTTMPGASIGGGIAGIASKYEAEGILVVNDRTKINEWEYIFDFSKYKPPPNPLSGPAAMPAQGQMNGTPASQMGTMPPPPGQQTTPPTTIGPGGGGGQ